VRTRLRKRNPKSGTRKKKKNSETKISDEATKKADKKTPKPALLRRKSTFKVPGTPDYLAPEALLGTGLDLPVDWWALGVILFEFLCGVPPFNDETPQMTFQNILNNNIPWEWLSEDTSGEARDLIAKLLCSDPEHRLGSRSTSDVKNHSFFAGINWDTLLEKPGIFVPKPTDVLDTGYFLDRTDIYGNTVLGSMPGEGAPLSNSGALASSDFDGFSFTNTKVLADLALKEVSNE